ncbi:hypothetical protein HYH03_004467 [Edaphochlamys debaryana]|uniref:Iron hydrogenase small subunit domain-containing protein n=1 Tax=Edaphochlamys debaryana TaxID=47281 RepID=A0A835Y805_9CHLO|nr:hypothetical protein HYH03_004467 [Edaphochlamys debaryana]|eukprot:KAG2497731.1 hypothetical protein HYH03_004467 [Edaphochlamys debaryana]
MEFSSTIRVADLNDYIAPSQDCVVALNGKLKVSETSEEVQLQRRPRAGGPAAAPGTNAPPPPGDPVKVSLHDCLACSGCITSAETVLLQQQSGGLLLERLADPGGPTVVVSVSAQSRAALAAYYGLTPAAAMGRLVGWLKALGVRAVWDLATARDLVLVEEAAEALARLRRAQGPGGAQGGPGGAPGPQADVDMASGEGASTSGRGAEAAAGAGGGGGPLPMMASSCPGWVCYAEKTHGAKVIPHMSPTRSPQGAMGALVKGPIASAWGLPGGASSLFHVSVMPCYDKKLEASRDELALPGPSGSPVPEVDCCLTTGEVLQLLQSHPAPGCKAEAGLADPACPSAPPDPLLPGMAPDDRLYGMPYGSSSGGYADYVFRTAARELYGVEVPPGPLPWRALRNSDFQELVLDPPSASGNGNGFGPSASSPSAPGLRFARVYGFRNIQTLLRQVKTGRCGYQYVEVMACPAGCLNGGGQPKPGPGVSPAQLLEQLEAAYTHADVAARQPSDNPAVAALYASCLGGRPGSEAAQRLLHTTFREREKTVTAAVVSNW